MIYETPHIRQYRARTNMALFEFSREVLVSMRLFNLLSPCCVTCSRGENTEHFL